MPKKSPGSRRRARAEARNGAKYTRALRRQPSFTSGPESEPGRADAFEVVAELLTRQAQEVRSRLGAAPGIDEIRRRFAAVNAFRSLGHSVDERPTSVDYAGHPQWQCRRCGNDLRLDSTGDWVSSGGTGQCLHEDASW